MYNTPIYYVFLFLHLISTVVGFGAVIVVDAFGLLWLLKWWGVDLSRVNKVAAITQRLIWLGWVGAVVTGGILLFMKGTGVSSLTAIKIFLVAMIGVNGVFLHTIKKSMEALPEGSNTVTSKIFFRIGLASFISQLGWWGAMIIGFLNREIKPQFHYASWPFMVGVLLVIGLAALIGELVTRPKVKPVEQVAADVLHQNGSGV